MRPQTKPTTAFWIIAVAALLCNLMGVFQFIGATFMLETMVEGLPENQADLYRGIPMWYTVVFAIAVFTGLLGCITMLARKRVTIVLFGFSLVAVLVAQFYWILGTEAMAIIGNTAAIMPVLVIIISIFLFYYNKGAAKNGWLS